MPLCKLGQRFKPLTEAYIARETVNGILLLLRIWSIFATSPFSFTGKKTTELKRY